MSLFYYYHSLSPFLIKISGNFGIRWYSISYLIGAIAVYFFALYFCKKGRISLEKDRILDIITYAAVGVVLGGRLGYCIFYNPGVLLDFNTQFPFWGFFKDL